MIEREFVGLTLSDQAKREAPAQAELGLPSPAVAARPFTGQPAGICFEGLRYFPSVNGIFKPQARQLEFPRI
jgi:hypothetical protein